MKQSNEQNEEGEHGKLKEIIVLALLEPRFFMFRLVFFAFAILKLNISFALCWLK